LNKLNSKPSRIKSSDVQLGESFIIGQYKKNNNQGYEGDDFKNGLEQMLIEAGQQAKAIVQEAEEKAAKIIKKAEEAALSKAQEIEDLKQQSIQNGLAEGFHKGYDEGMATAKKEVIENVWGVGALASSAFKIKKEIIDSAEKEVLELAVAIAEKVIRHELEIKPELMQEIVKAAIAQLKDKEEIKIIINPALIQNLYEFTEEFKKTIKGLKSIKIIEDKTIPKDGVIVESPESRIDARIETQLREIVRNIMQEFSQKSLVEAIPEEIEVRIQDKMSERNES